MLTHFYFSSQTEEREVMQLVGADRTLPATKTICDWKGSSAAQRWTLSTFHPLHFYCVPAHSHSHGPLDSLTPPGCSSRSPALSVSQPLPHPLRPRLAVVFEWCSADGKRWAMTDGYDKQMVLLVIFNHTNSVSRDAGASSCQTAQSRDKFIQPTIEFDTENLLGEKRLHQNDVLARWGERWYKSAECTISFSNQKG